MVKERSLKKYTINLTAGHSGFFVVSKNPKFKIKKKLILKFYPQFFFL